MIHRSPINAEDANGNPTRRRFGRLRQRLFRCNLGEVMDISPAGMRIKCRRKPSRRKAFSITFKGFDLPDPLLGRRTWSRRIGLFLHEVGIEFVDPTPNLVDRLAAIAGCSVTRRVTAESLSRAA